MKTLEEVKRILDMHKEKLKERFGVKEIEIFGSYVRGEQTEKSDVDILVEKTGDKRGTERPNLIRGH